MARKKKTATPARLRAIQEKIEVQRRRAQRPALPVNSHAQVSKSRLEQERAAARKRAQRKAWEDENT
ncbi:MAG TPA: hypothetical protein VKT51_00095 [Candidatus Eremiobacteraceae bacterium]|nr:hypothetical protein [Candidatus Eremiobacteraceae bacterium]